MSTVGIKKERFSLESISCKQEAQLTVFRLKNVDITIQDYGFQADLCFGLAFVSCRR